MYCTWFMYSMQYCTSNQSCCDEGFTLNPFCNKVLLLGMFLFSSNSHFAAITQRSEIRTKNFFLILRRFEIPVVFSKSSQFWYGHADAIRNLQKSEIQTIIKLLIRNIQQPLDNLCNFENSHSLLYYTWKEHKINLENTDAVSELFAHTVSKMFHS